MASHSETHTLEHEKTHHVTDRGYDDQEKLERCDVGTNVPGEVKRSGKWVMAAYEILTDSLYPRSETFRIEEKFLALSDLKHILSTDFIEDLMSEVFQGPPEEVPNVEEICGDSYKSRRMQILATLILIGGVSLITSFVDFPMFDDSLPLTNDHPIFETWETKEKNEFCSKQYIVLAPFLNLSSDKMRHYELPSMTCMPFMHQQVRIGRGKDGDIWRTTIHPDHQYYEPEKHYGIHFAIKEFTADGKDDFESEKRALERFSGPNKGHPHLIRLLLSYQIGQKYYMVFPLAKSNLSEHWKERKSDPTSPHDLIWLIEQCLGIARGLQKIHRHDSWLLRNGGAVHAHNQNRGRHGDIKPENILCFDQALPERYRLVIADFTLMRFHAETSVGKSLARGMAHSPKYRPPELNLSHRTKVNQSYDIWTLACVYLEFLTWYLLGYEAAYGDSFVEIETGRTLQNFDLLRRNDDDKFYGFPENKFFGLIPNSSSPQVKKSVKKWMNYLHCHKDTSQPIHRFLNFIDFHMLVPEHGTRAAVDTVCTELDTIYSFCVSNKNTCHIGEPDGKVDDSFPPVFTQGCLNYDTSSTTTSATESMPITASTAELNPDMPVLEQLMFPSETDPPNAASSASPIRNTSRLPAIRVSGDSDINTRLEIPQIRGTSLSHSGESSAADSLWSDEASEAQSVSERSSLLPGGKTGSTGLRHSILYPNAPDDRRENHAEGPLSVSVRGRRALIIFDRLREGVTKWLKKALKWVMRSFHTELE